MTTADRWLLRAWLALALAAMVAIAVALWRPSKPTNWTITGTWVRIGDAPEVSPTITPEPEPAPTARIGLRNCLPRHAQAAWGDGRAT